MDKNRININRKRPSKSEQDFFSQIEKQEPKTTKSLKGKMRKTYARATFIIEIEQLEKFKDFIHTRKKKNYMYSQKQAIKEALELLFNTIDEIEKRDDDQQ